MNKIVKLYFRGVFTYEEVILELLEEGYSEFEARKMLDEPASN